MEKPTTISHHDVLMAMDQAKDTLLKLPFGAYLPGMTRPLTDGERLALAYLAGVLTVVGSHGVDTAHLVFEYRTPDSEALE